MFQFIKNNPETLLPIMVIFISIASIPFDNTIIIFILMHFISVILMIIFACVSLRKTKKRRHRLEKKQWEFIAKYFDNNMAIVKFFVPIKSEYQIVNQWRKYKGIHVLSRYSAAYTEDDRVKSYVLYKLTKNEFFQAKLKGYISTTDLAVAKRAINDPMMTKRERI